MCDVLIPVLHLVFPYEKTSPPTINVLKFSFGIFGLKITGENFKKQLSHLWFLDNKLVDCSTTDGKKCVFPFKYKDVTYNGCTKIKNKNVLWCSTKTDEQGNYITGGNWGNCSETCQKGKA